MDRIAFSRALAALALCVPLCLLMSADTRAEPETASETAPEEVFETENPLEDISLETVDIAPATFPLIDDYSGLVAADSPSGFQLVQPTESYEVDARTGLPKQDAVEGETDEYYPLSPGISGFDKLSRRYVNHVGSRSFTTNVPNGAILSKGSEVSIEIPAGLTGILYLDGDIVTEPQLTQLRDPGSYTLSVQSAQNLESGSFNFIIFDDLVNNVSEYTLPEGFRFNSIQLNDEMLFPDYSNYCEFIEDGRYNISWGCEAIGQSFTLTFFRDTETPELTITGLTKEPPQGEAHGPVTLSWKDEGAYLLVRSEDGKEHRIATSPAEIAESGEYTVTICDVAGNSESYDFTIHVYLNISAYASIVLVAASIVCLIMYSRRVKRHSRVG